MGHTNPSNPPCFNGASPAANGTCICPDSHVTGLYCDLINCENGGRDSGRGYCVCPDRTTFPPYCLRDDGTADRPIIALLTIPICAFAFVAVLCFLSWLTKRIRDRSSAGTTRAVAMETREVRPAHERLLPYSDLPPDYSPPPTYERAVRAYISASLGTVLVTSQAGANVDIETGRKAQRLCYSASQKERRGAYCKLVGWRQYSRSL